VKLHEFEETLVELLGQMEFDTAEEVTQLASCLAAASVKIISQINEVQNEDLSFPPDDKYTENLANISTLVFSLGIDVVSISPERVANAFGALYSRLGRKCVLGTVDGSQLLGTLLGVLVSHVAGYIIAAHHDKTDDTERWQAVAKVLRKDLFDRIAAEIAKHNPSVGELN
jgi:hypothetical protein